MKFRRILAILLAAALLLGMMPAALADAPAPKPSTADYCSQSSDGKHQMQWTVVEPPTCTQKGLQTGVCALCRYATRQDVPPTGHNFTGGGYEWIKEPTCTQEGLKQVWCANRGCEETRQETVPALGHDWTEWETTKEATCTEAGSRRRACSRCGETQDETVSALGHKYTSSVVLREPTCAMVGERLAKCERCGQTVSEAIPTVPHTFTDDWTVALEAGDWNAGVKTRKCAVCGQAERQPFYLEGTILPEDRGDAMKGLQEALNEHGFDCGTADGIYGPKTQAAIEAAEETAGHEATGIGWTGLQKWLADGAVPAPDDDTDYGWTPPATMGNAYDAGSKLTEARNKPPKNEEDPLHIILQPEGGLLAHDHSASTVPAITLRVRAAGGVTPYAYEWHYKPKMADSLLAAKLNQMGSALTESYNRIKASLGTAQNTAYPVAGASGGRTLADFSRVVGDNTGACVVASVGMYYCVITDAAGEVVTSDTVEVGYKLFISQQPQNANIRGKESVSFSCVAAGGDGSPYEYEWHLPDGSVRKTSDGTLKDVSDLGEYDCVVTCGGEKATSNRVKLYDNDPLSVKCVQNTYYIGGKYETASIKMCVEGGIPPYQCHWAMAKPERYRDESGHFQWTAGESATVLDEYEANVNVSDGWYTNPWKAEETGWYWFGVSDGAGNYQEDVVRVVDVKDDPLVILQRPQDCQLDVNNGWIYVYTIMGNGEGAMQYYLCEKGKSREKGDQYTNYNAYSADNPDRLMGRNIVSEPGEYYIHVEDSAGRSADTDVFTVSEYGSTPSGGSGRQLRIAGQPVGGDIYTVPGKVGWTLSITMDEGDGNLYYYLYRNGNLFDYEANSSNDPDRLHYEYTTTAPGEYYYHVEDGKGNWADSNTVTVTSSSLRVVIDISGGENTTYYSADIAAGNPVTLTAQVYAGTGFIKYAWKLNERSGHDFNCFDYSENVSNSNSVTADRPGVYMVTVTDETGQTDSAGVTIKYVGGEPIIVQQPTCLKGKWYSNKPGAEGWVDTPRMTCRAVIKSGGVDYERADYYSGLKYEWEVKSPGTGGWIAAGRGSTIEVDGKAGSTYRCRITNTSTGDYVYTNEAQVSSIEVLTAKETMMSDKEHSHYHLLFSGGTGPYLVELRRYTSWCVDSDRAVHSQWLITDADPKSCDFWNLEPGGLDKDLAGEYIETVYYYVITDYATGECVSNRPW